MGVLQRLLGKQMERGRARQRRGAVVERQRAAVVAGTLARREEAPRPLLRVRSIRGRGRRGGAAPPPWPRAGLALARAGARRCGRGLWAPTRRARGMWM